MNDFNLLDYMDSFEFSSKTPNKNDKAQNNNQPKNNNSPNKQKMRNNNSQPQKRNTPGQNQNKGQNQNNKPQGNGNPMQRPQSAQNKDNSFNKNEPNQSKQIQPNTKQNEHVQKTNTEVVKEPAKIQNTDNKVNETNAEITTAAPKDNLNNEPVLATEVTKNEPDNKPINTSVEEPAEVSITIPFEQAQSEDAEKKNEIKGGVSNAISEQAVATDIENESIIQEKENQIHNLEELDKQEKKTETQEQTKAMPAKDNENTETIAPVKEETAEGDDLENEFMQPLPDNFIRDNNNIGAKLNEESAARIINISVDDLKRVTELYNEYLTCSKEDGHFFYNRYDIATILRILYDQADTGYTDKDMLAYMKDDESYSRPFKDNAQDFPEQVRLAVGQAFKGYAYELQNSVRSLISQLGEAVKSMDATIASQKSMLDEQTKIMNSQTLLIQKMAGQLENDSKSLDNIKDLPRLIGDMPKTFTENAEKQHKEINEILMQMRSGQGETKKAISEIKTELEAVRENGKGKDDEKRLEKLSGTLDKIAQSQAEEAKKLAELSSSFNESGELKEQCAFLKEKLSSAQKTLDQSKPIEEYNSLAEELDKANEHAKELEDKLTSSSDALRIAQAKEEAHVKDTETYKTKVNAALKNLTREIDGKTRRIKELEEQIKNLEEINEMEQIKERPAPQRTVQTSPERTRQVSVKRVSPAMTTEQRRAVQKQYAEDVSKKIADVDSALAAKPKIPSWAASSQYAEEELDDEIKAPAKKEKHGLFGKKKTKEPIIEDVELDDEADLVENSKRKKGLFRR